MPGFPFIDGILFIDGDELSDWMRGGELEVTKETTPSPRVMGQITERHHAVITNWVLRARLSQDFAATGPHATLFTPFAAGTVVAWRYRPKSGAIAADNPEFQGNGIITRYPPLSGGHGDEPEVAIEIVPSGSANDLVVDTTP